MKKGTRPPAKLKTRLAAQRRDKKRGKALDARFLGVCGIAAEHFTPGLLRPNPACAMLKGGTITSGGHVIWPLVAPEGIEPEPLG